MFIIHFYSQFNSILLLFFFCGIIIISLLAFLIVLYFFMLALATHLKTLSGSLYLYVTLTLHWCLFFFSNLHLQSFILCLCCSPSSVNLVIWTVGSLLRGYNNNNRKIKERLLPPLTTQRNFHLFIKLCVFCGSNIHISVSSSAISFYMVWHRPTPYLHINSFNF